MTKTELIDKIRKWNSLILVVAVLFLILQFTLGQICVLHNLYVTIGFLIISAIITLSAFKLPIKHKNDKTSHDLHVE